MNIRIIQFKRAAKVVLLTLLLSAIGMTKGYAYDFSAVCETGQTLYYNITDATNHYVELTYPGINYSYWEGFTQPTGNVILPSSVNYNGVSFFLTSIGAMAFFSCYDLTSIEIPNSVTSIGYAAFWHCDGLTTIEIPNSVTHIGNEAFRVCTNLTTIEIPNSVSYISDRAFANCSGLEQIIVDSGNTVYDSRENCNAIILTSTNELVAGCKNTVIPNVITSIRNYAFESCSGLTSIEIPNSVSSIGYCAFYSCSGLTSIEIPNSVSSIGGSAFWGCHGLTGNLTIPNSVTTIEESTFNSCSSLTSLTIGNSVTTIGSNAFSGCSDLTSMTVLAETPPVCGENAFYYVPNSIPVYTPCSAVEDYQIANGWGQFHQYCGLCSGEVIVTANPFEGGMVTGAGYYNGGEICVLTATAISDFVFVNWTENGRVVSTDSVYSFYAHPTTIVANFCSNNPIDFADADVKALCVANWDTNGDGELSYTEAATVTDLGEVFKYNSTITSFDELRYFISLTSIDRYAFYNCYNLASVIIPSSVTSIRYGAFSGCDNLISIVLPSSVISIGSYAFDCYGLSSIISLAETPPTLGYNSFGNWSSNVLCYVPCGFANTYISLTWGGFSNFEELCGGMITVIASPEEGGVVTGGGYFEAGQSFTVMATPNEGYTFINWTQNGAMVSSQAEYTFYVAGDMTLVAHFSGNIIFDDSHVKSICVSHWDTNGDGELSSAEAADVMDLSGYFRNNSEITSFDELQYFTGLSSIGNYAFENCNGLTSVVLPNTVVSIGNRAFYGCSGLIGELTIPNSVTTIGSGAFYGCSGFTGALTIPHSVTSIGSSAFYNCSGLTGELNIPSSVTSIGGYAFSNCSGFIGSLTIPNSVTSIEGGTFSGCSGFTGSLTIPNSVTSIGGWAFFGCSGFTGSLTIPNFVTTIGDWAFNGCSGFTGNLTVGNSVTSIGERAFLDCSGFTGNLIIPNSVISIGNLAFYGCSSFTGNLTIGNSVNSIGKMAFRFCSGFTGDLTIPNSVITIGNGAFGECSSFTGSLTIGNSVTEIEGYAFSYCSFTGILTIPNSVTTIGDLAFQDCNFTGDLIIPNSVTTIGFGAFNTCFGFSGNLTIGNSVTLIDDYAFAGCRFISMNVLAEVPPTLGSDYSSSVFDNYNIPVAVPCGLIETYQNALVWNKFTNYIEACAGEIIVTVNPTEGGTVTGAGYYEGGATCTLTAMANEGFTFVYWMKDGAIVSTNPNYSFIVTGNTSFIAKFSSIEDWNLPIQFADANVKTLCVANWDADGDGELSYAEAAAVTDLGEVFKSNSSITSFDELQFFINLTSINSSAFYYCYHLTSIEIPNSVNSIGGLAFSGCSGLISIEIPSSVTSIGSYSFEYCSSLTSLTIPNSVTSIGEGVFRDCIGLEQIIVDSGNRVYDSRDNCKAIIRTSTNELVTGCKNTMIPNSVTSIGIFAFDGCINLTTIEIPSSVTWIGPFAFWNCNALTSITVFSEIPPLLGGLAFGQVNKSIPVYVPCRSLIAYQSPKGWNEFTNYIPGTECDSGEITVTANPVEGGLITGAGYYEGGVTCTLTATANPGYTFINWTKDGIKVSDSETYSFIVAGDALFVANFVPIGLVVAEYYPDVNNSESQYVKVYWNFVGEELPHHYRIYRTTCEGNNSIITLADDVTDTYYIDTTWEYVSGSIYKYGVSCVYENGRQTNINWALSRNRANVQAATPPKRINYSQTENSCGLAPFAKTQNHTNLPTLHRGEFTECIVAENGKYFGHFTLNNPSEVIPYEFYIEDFTQGACYMDGVYYFSNASGTFGTFSPETGLTVIATGRPFGQIEYNPVDGKLYGFGFGSNAGLYEVNPFDGSYTEIAYIPTSYALTFTISNEGRFIICDGGDDCIKEYDFATGELIPLIYVGWDINYGQDMAMDRETNEVYWAACNASVTLYPLIKVNLTDNTLIYVGYFENQVAAFANANIQVSVPVWSNCIEKGDMCEVVFDLHDSWGDGWTGNCLVVNFEDGTSQNLTISSGSYSSQTLFIETGSHITLSWIEGICISDCSFTVSYADGTVIYEGTNLNNTSFEFNVNCNGSSDITQTTDLAQGYNWWCTYIEQEGMDGLGLLQEGLGNNGVSIRSQASGYTDYYTGYGWYGSLSSINNESSYRVITSTPCTVTMTGNAAAPSQHPITLSQGWSWIGYVPSIAMSVDVAMTGVSAMQGDKLKSQHGYSEYYPSYGWFGSLNTIEPGMGLMYYSANGESVTFAYPDGNRGGELKKNLTAENNHWKPNTHAYPDNMTVMAVVELNEMELKSDNYELAVFANGECRGSVRLTYAEPLHRHVAFLTISGKDAAELSFRLYDMETGMEYYDAEESLDFVANAIVGEADDLYTIHFRGTTGMDEFASRVQVYPNPVNAGERFSINVADDVKTPVRVEIVNALGVETLRATSVQVPAQLTAPATAGVYTLRITVEGKGTVVRKLVVK